MTQRVVRTGVWRRSFQLVQRLMLGDANFQMPASSHLISHVMLSSCSIVIGQPDHHLQALASFSIRVSCARPRTMACFPLSLEVRMPLSPPHAAMRRNSFSSLATFSAPNKFDQQHPSQPDFSTVFGNAVTSNLLGTQDTFSTYIWS